QDQHDVEFPGEVFDINQLFCDSYAARYTLKNQEYFDLLKVDAWYNYTRFTGDTQHPSKAVQIPQLLQLAFVRATAADIQSSGFRSAVTWGEEKCPQLTVGLDMRYLSQYLNEYDNIPPTGIVNNPIPRSHWSDPGVFVDTVLPVNDQL